MSQSAEAKTCTSTTTAAGKAAKIVCRWFAKQSAAHLRVKCEICYLYTIGNDGQTGNATFFSRLNVVWWLFQKQEIITIPRRIIWNNSCSFSEHMWRKKNKLLPFFSRTRSVGSTKTKRTLNYSRGRNFSLRPPLKNPQQKRKCGSRPAFQMCTYNWFHLLRKVIRYLWTMTRKHEDLDAQPTSKIIPIILNNLSFSLESIPGVSSTKL